MEIARKSTEIQNLKKQLKLKKATSAHQSNTTQRKNNIIKVQTRELKQNEKAVSNPYGDLSVREAASVLREKLSDLATSEKRSLKARASENAILEQLFDVVNERFVDYRGGVYAQNKKPESSREIRRKDAAWMREFIEKRIEKYQLSARCIF